MEAKLAGHAGKSERRSLSSATRKRILAAARKCFETLGIEQTTIVDIATEANYSRPIVYKHFADKSAIIDAICLEELEVLQAKLVQRLGDDLPPSEELTEAIVVAIILAKDSPHITRFMEDRDSWVRSQKVGEQVRDWVRKRWEAFIKRGQESGALANDIDVENVVTWIAMNQSQLLLRYQDEDIDEDWLRNFIRRFVVRPLLAKP